MFDGTQVGDPMAEGGHIGPVVNKAQFDKIQGLIQSAIDEGATLETGGTGLPANVTRGSYTKPTVFSGLTSAIRIANQQLSRPVATLLPYPAPDPSVDLPHYPQYSLPAPTPLNPPPPP